MQELKLGGVNITHIARGRCRVGPQRVRSRAPVGVQGGEAPRRIMVLTVLKTPKPFEKLPLFVVNTVTLVKILCIFYNTMSFLVDFKLMNLN